MNNQKIREFFDSLAPSWDDHMVIDPVIIDRIFSCACVSEGKDVLDVACGTGVLCSFFKERNAASISGIDLSEKMCSIARAKGYTAVYEGDASTYPYPQTYDVILVYNAFPHIADRKAFFAHMAESLNNNGTLTVAHGMSREALQKHHHGVSDEVSSPLPEIEEMAKQMEPWFTITHTISDEKMYLVTGRKR